MVILTLISIVLLVVVGDRLGLAPARWLRHEAESVWPTVRSYIASAPGTFIYLLVVAVTEWVLATSSDRTGSELLVGHSSTLRNLAEQPLQGLIQSAFWLATPGELAVALAFAALLAPVERWLGTLRWLLVGAAGHIGATILVALIQWGGITADVVDTSVRHGVDVGVSYFFLAIAGVLTYRLSVRSARRYLIGWGIVLLAILALAPSFTAVGHLLAFAIGLAFAPLTRSADVVRRAQDPLYPRVWRR